MTTAARNDRGSSRIPVDLDVTLVAGDSVPFYGELINISINGAYVRSDSTALVPNTPVTIILGGEEEEDREMHRMLATVVRHDGEGAGVTFSEFDHDTVMSLRHIYHITHRTQ